MGECRLKIGLGQINPTVGDIANNTKKIISYIDRAESEKTDLLVFPEMSLCGYPIWDLANKAGFIGDVLSALNKIAQYTSGKKTTVAVGFIDQHPQNPKKSYNAIAIIQNGKVIQRQYKTLLPTYDVFLENIFFSQAESHKPFTLNEVLIAPTICEDIWDDEYSIKPGKIYAQKGAKILINISASPYHRHVSKIRGDLVSRKAKEYGLWIIYVNQVGGQDDLIFDGRSLVCDPRGEIIYSAKPFVEDLFFVELDAEKPRSCQLSTIPTNQVQEMYDALCMGLKDYVRKNKFKKVVVGLSGGIDSALVATIAADALGSDAVIGVSMPGPFSSAGSKDDAEKLAKNLRIEYRVKSIKDLYEQFIGQVVEDKSKRGIDPQEQRQISLAMENLQSRLRGMQLMYLSNDENTLLLTTGNKSELAMGYGTLYGDMCGGLSVIGDVYKTDVYSLANYRNSLGVVIPQDSIEKPPSAELRPNQKDSDSLPEYSVLDTILYHYIEKNMSCGQIVQELNSKNIPEDLIRRVITKVDHNEYKRRQLAPCLRVSEKAWFGRRMPITNQYKQ